GVNPGLYERGHIQAAVNFHWHTGLVNTVERDVVGQDADQNLLRNAGISNHTVTVLYGDTSNRSAAWGAWAFDSYGVNNVKLLDGGRKKCEAEGRPLTITPATPAAGNIVGQAADESLRARLTDVVAVAKKEQDAVLVDIRSADEYNGKI